MHAATCPSHDTLFDYAVGKLSDEASQDVAEHLESCPDCQAGLATFDDADDTLVARLRLPAVDDPFLDESQCDAAMARAKAVTGSNSTLGEELGEYELLEELGRGGMGTVYKALHTKLDRVVALKVLSEGRMADPRAITRFEREMKAIGRLDHPHIVHAHDAREIAGKPVLVMEYVEGLDLAKLSRRCGPLGVADACELVRQTALGLQYAHENHLVHRDIKPSNLMLTAGGEVKMLDLGLARFHVEQPSGEEMTGTGQAMGTADYMAPEQTSDSRTVDIRADIYSLGCTLYKLLCGHAPFSGPQYKGAFEKMTAHVNDSAAAIRDLVSEVPDQLTAVLDRMLAKDADERFATPAEVAEALQPFCVDCDLEGLAIRAQETSPEAPDEFSSREISDRPAVSVPQGASRWRRLLGVAVALLLVGGFGFAMGVIITITRDGRTTTLEVPDGAEVKIGEKGQVGVKLARKQRSVQAAPKSDLAALQGTWEVLSVEFGGKKFPEQLVEKMKFVFKGNRLTTNEEVEFSLDPTKTPKTIDVVNWDDAHTKSATELGIYELQGDQLKLCIEGGQRPTEFAAPTGSKNTLFVLRRVADEAATVMASPHAQVPNLVSSARKTAQINVDVDRHGTILVDGEEHDLPSLERTLRDILPSKKVNVRLRCARELPWNRAVEFVELLRTAGVHEYSLTVADPAARLDFRIAATRGGDGKPGLSAEEIKRYVEALKANGPQTTRPSEEPFAWFELAGDAGPELITATYQDRHYVLLAATPNEVMLASEVRRPEVEEGGVRTWGLTAVHLETDPQGHPALGVDFNEAGRKRFEALTGSHLKQPLAILLNGRVVSVPRIQAKLSRRALIMGRFSDEQVQQMLEALRAGMVTPPAAEEKAQAS